MLRRLSLMTSAAILAGASPAFAHFESESGEMAELRAQIDALQARIVELERGAADAQAVQVANPATPGATVSEAPNIRFRGAPRIEAGAWSFKPRGRLQYDFGHVSSPDGISEPGLGFSNELRRARLGVEGEMPGGFGYVVELDLGEGDVQFADTVLTYAVSDAVKLTLGQHNGFQSLDELTSSRFTSFMERAAFTDAFNFERRVGLSGQFARGDLTAQAGVFTDSIQDLDQANEAIGVDGRLVYAPMLGKTRLHLGGSLHWRDYGGGDLLGTTTRYRQRPFIHSTDVRFLATPALPVEQESRYGLEAAMISGPFHAAGEVHWLRADTLTPGLRPEFFGAYAEVGYYLTGESRGYRGARFDRTSVSRPIEEGGIGAFQINFRYDHLDLNSAGIIGGIQSGLQASLIWIPTDYVRFLINYARLGYDDAALQATGGDREYSVDIFAARAQIDF